MAGNTIIPATTIPIPDSVIKSSKKLRLGPGITHTPPSTLTATLLGELKSDPRKHAIWIDPFGKGGRYVPAPNDLILGIALRSGAESTTVQLSPYSPTVSLPSSNFESSSKKLRPQMFPGDVIYARICPPETNSSSSSAQAVQKLSYDTLELSCVSATTGKTDGLGPLKGGMVFSVSVGIAAKLVRGKKEGINVLDLLGEKIEFECIVGKNGRVWVDSKDVKVIVLVGRVLSWLDEDCGKREAGGVPSEGQQRMMVERLIKEMA